MSSRFFTFPCLFLVFICFHSRASPGGGPPHAGNSWSACHHLFPQGPQPRPGSSPTWPSLVSSLPLAEESYELGTWRAGPGQCLPACCLSTSSVPALHFYPLQSQDLAQCDSPEPSSSRGAPRDTVSHCVAPQTPCLAHTQWHPRPASHRQVGPLWGRAVERLWGGVELHKVKQCEPPGSLLQRPSDPERVKRREYGDTVATRVLTM